VKEYILSASKSSEQLENQYDLLKKNASEMASNPSSEAKLFVEKFLNKKL
jgi:LAO/AO transport system kinase